ncbi:hypothetical protein, partial [Yersinia enterocolitica]
IKAINDHAQGERREPLMTLPAHYRWHSVNTTCNARHFALFLYLSAHALPIFRQSSNIAPFLLA